MRTRLLIVEPCIPDYRVVFLNALRRRLDTDGVDVSVLYGSADQARGFAEGLQEVAGSERRQVIRAGQRPYWITGAIRDACKAEYVILAEGIAPLHNHVMLTLRGLGLVGQVAFWGHGWDFLHGERSDGLGRLKAWERKKVDWWFAYTDISADKLRAQGFPEKRITVVNNANDVKGLRGALVSVTPTQSEEKIRRLFPESVPEGRVIGVFCSRLSDHKDVGFALRAAEVVHRSMPGFRLIVMGGGDQEQLVREFSRSRSWCAHLGPVYGTDRAVYLKRADVWLTSGAVGLEAVDALAAGIPIVIRRGCGHGPEMAYIKSGENALVVEGDVETYASHVADILRDERRTQMVRGQALATGDGLGAEAMAERFAAGVAAWIGESTKGSG